LSGVRWASWLDPWLYRRPFTGRSAHRYSHVERPGFGDLDRRLCSAWQLDLAGARCVLDLGAGPGTVGRSLIAHFPGVQVIEIEPSPDFATAPRAPGDAAIRPGSGQAVRIRARAEALPLATGSIDAAVSVSAIRHVADRARALAELRRVIRPGGVALIVELDPEAPPSRVATHARGVRSWVLGAMFGPLVVATAPTARVIEDAARSAGWRDVARRDDDVQPVYELRLS
jgi:SAM-dependent methyltransferase